jgi:peptidyl-prolyl cis-trans isomerase B (cyclophilin B)
MPRLLALLLACLLLLAACGDDDDEETASTPTPTPEETATPEPAATPEDTGGEQGTGCEKAARPRPRNRELSRPKERLDPSKTYVATVSTNCGDFEITLDAERAPKTGGSFKYLADKGFYDGLTFHRIVPGFVIQGGDPQGTGGGGPGYQVVEAPPEDLVYEKGTVAMAKTQIEDPGTSGSQFFVVTVDGAPLEPDYALVGNVTKGMEVVDLIGVAPIGPDEQPVEPIVMRSVKVEES